MLLLRKTIYKILYRFHLFASINAFHFSVNAYLWYQVQDLSVEIILTYFIRGSITVQLTSRLLVCIHQIFLFLCKYAPYVILCSNIISPETDTNYFIKGKVSPYIRPLLFYLFDFNQRSKFDDNFIMIRQLNPIQLYSDTSPYYCKESFVWFVFLTCFYSFSLIKLLLIALVFALSLSFLPEAEILLCRYNSSLDSFFAKANGYKILCWPWRPSKDLFQFFPCLLLSQTNYQQYLYFRMWQHEVMAT